MLDNLYLDKLKVSITESDYDKFCQSLSVQATEANHQLRELEEANNNYYIPAKYVLLFMREAGELFESSEVEQKRHLIKLILQNVCLDAENIVYDAVKPFDALLKIGDCQMWCAR